MISLRTPILYLPDSPLPSSDSPKVARLSLTEESSDQEDGRQESEEQRITRAWKVDDEIITYKRRSRIGGKSEKSGKGDEFCNYKSESAAGVRKWTDPDELELELPEDLSDCDADTVDAIDPTDDTSGKVCGRASAQAIGFGRAKTLSTIKTWKRVIGIQKTLAPRRVIGQYFLDLGQADFSYTTCPTCGLFYARGHENDEKVHKTFHRNRTQGIIFKGWQSERVASRVDDKGSRVIVVLAEDSHHQAKVREVINVMELELGLTPGWLLQRSCKVYLFISASKKIVGCLMAEPIKSAFKVVSVRSQSFRKGGELYLNDREEKKPSILKTHLQSSLNETSSQLDRRASELPATRSDEMNESEQGFTEGEIRLLPNNSSGVSSEDLISASRLSSICVSKCAVPGQSQERISKIMGAPLHPPSFNVQQERGSLRDTMKAPKITDFFSLKTRHTGSREICKSERDVINSKIYVNGTNVKAENDEESSHNFFVSGQDKLHECTQLENEGKVSPSFVPETTEDKRGPSASRSTGADVQDGDTREGRHNKDNVMLFGNIKFRREMPSRKRTSTERTQDLGSAILCTKTPVPAVCGVRVIWVSHMERRKGVASHLLDAMRKTFSLGVVLEPSQFAFTQPTPEGRKFAAWYCKTDEFLVYTSS